MKKCLLFIQILCFCLLFSACNNKSKKPPVDLTKIDAVDDISVHYSEIGGVKTIPVAINGVTMDMIYDTGCSGMHFSLHELQTLYKNGKFSQEDILGSSTSQIADGSIVENGIIILREVRIGGEDGIVLHNIEASVALNQTAPLLLGNGVLDELASVEVDNMTKTIKFKRY